MAKRDGSRSLFNRSPETVGNFAMVQPQLTRMTGAPLRTVDDGVDRGTLTDDAWQHEGYRLTREVGEIGFVMHGSADTLAQGVLVVDEWKNNRWVPSEDARALRCMAAFVDARGSDYDLKRRAGLHTGIAGESYLVGSPGKTPQGINTGIVWEFLSTEELSFTFGTEEVVRRRDGTSGQNLGKDVYIARMYRSDPEFSLRADSAMRRALPIAREVLRLTHLVDAVLSSRLNAGIFYVPHEVSFAKEDHEDTDSDEQSYGDEDDPNAGIDEFSKLLIQQLTAPVRDRGNQASLVPLLMRGPALIADHPMKELMGLISLERNLDTWAMELRQEALHRLAASLDVPIETLEGKSGLSHWSAFAVDSELITRHVAPKGYLLADFLTVAYLRPMLEAFENVTPGLSAKFRVRYDISALKSAMDEATFTRFAYDRGEASGMALRRSHGVDETDAPDDAEIAERNAKDLIRAVPLLAPALLKKIRGLEDVDLDIFGASKTWLGDDVPGPGGGDPTGAGALGPAQPAGRKQDPGSARSLGPGTSKTSGMDQPTQQRRDSTGPTGRADQGGQMPAPAGPSHQMSLLVERIATSADAALERAFERAGGRLTSAAVNRKDLTLRDRLAGGNKAMATTLVSPSEMQALGLTPGGLLADAWDSFSLRSRAWVRDYLEAEGVDPLVADDRAAFAISALCEDLHAYAATNLHRGLPAAAAGGLRVPTELVVRALSTSMPVLV